MSKNSYNYNEKKKVSVFSIIEVIVIIILAVMIVGMIACNILFRSDNTAASIFGYSFYKTRAVNMVPEIPVNTVIIAKKSEIPNIKERSVILCNIGEYTALTRVVEISQEEDKTYYIVKFDTSPANETFRIEEDAVIAKAIWQLESFGKFLDFATSVPGILIAVIIPLSIIIIFQIIRIKNIRELEKEASSIDDMEDIFTRKKEENPPAVTFTEPKFSEDITGKLPAIKPRSSFIEPEPKAKAQLTVDSNGKANYAVVEKKETADKAVNPLTSPIPSRQPAAVSAKSASGNGEDLYINRPTKIESRPKTDDFSFRTPVSSDNTEPSASSEKVVFTPHMSNVIPESLANIQDEAASSNTKPTGFDDSVKAYFERERKELKAETTSAEEQPHINEAAKFSSIPEKAVIPKDNIAPVKKKKSSKTLEELMSIIDSEESKLKK